MICPNCQNELKEGAKFCTKCGCNLVEASARMQIPPQPAALLCPNCGGALKPGMKFCTSCGCKVVEANAQPVQTPPVQMQPVQPVPVQMQPVQSAPVQMQPVSEPSSSDATILLTQEEPTPMPTSATPQPAASVPTCQNCGAELKPGVKFCTKCGTPISEASSPIQTPVAPMPTPAAPVSASPIPTPAAPMPNIPEMVPPTEKPKKQKKAEKPPKPEKEEKSSGGLMVLWVILALIVITVAVVAVLMINDIISTPSFLSGIFNKQTEKEIDDEETETETETGTDAAIDVDADTLFADLDASVETAKGKLSDSAQSADAMSELSAAINDYVAKAEEAGDLTIASDRITAAYTAYVQAVEAHKELLNSSSLSGAIYGQVMQELEEAISLGDELVSKGYSVDTSSLVSSKDAFDSSYTQRMIDTFDELTTRDAWSRTEAWNLMSAAADNMFNPSEDLDDPIRLRYTYALAWWTQKQIETELADGTITDKGAAIKIANLIEDMDYNLMMVDYYIQYMNAAGEDCSSVEAAYDEAVSHVLETQGLYIGSDVDLAHFWSFNDVDNPSSGVQDGTWNGLTQENREWIRTRMANASFVEG